MLQVSLQRCRGDAELAGIDQDFDQVREATA